MKRINEKVFHRLLADVYRNSGRESENFCVGNRKFFYMIIGNGGIQKGFTGSEQKFHID